MSFDDAGSFSATLSMAMYRALFIYLRGETVSLPMDQYHMRRNTRRPKLLRSTMTTTAKENFVQHQTL